MNLCSLYVISFNTLRVHYKQARSQGGEVGSPLEHIFGTFNTYFYNIASISPIYMR